MISANPGSKPYFSDVTSPTGRRNAVSTQCQIQFGLSHLCLTSEFSCRGQTAPPCLGQKVSKNFVLIRRTGSVSRYPFFLPRVLMAQVESECQRCSTLSLTIFLFATSEFVAACFKPSESLISSTFGSRLSQKIYALKLLLGLFFSWGPSPTFLGSGLWYVMRTL